MYDELTDSQCDEIFDALQPVARQIRQLAQQTRQADFRLKGLSDRLGRAARKQLGPHVAYWTSGLGHQKTIRASTLPELRAKLAGFHDYLLGTQNLLTYRVWAGPSATLSVFAENDGNLAERKRCHDHIASARRKGLVSILHATPDGDWVLARGKSYAAACADERSIFAERPDVARDLRRENARREVFYA